MRSPLCWCSTKENYAIELNSENSLYTLWVKQAENEMKRATNKFARNRFTAVHAINSINKIFSNDQLQCDTFVYLVTGFIVSSLFFIIATDYCYYFLCTIQTNICVCECDVHFTGLNVPFVQINETIISKWSEMTNQKSHKQNPITSSEMERFYVRARSNVYLRSAPPAATVDAAQTKLWCFVLPARIQCLKRAFRIQNAVEWFVSALIGSDIVTVA